MKNTLQYSAVYLISFTTLTLLSACSEQEMSNCRCDVNVDDGPVEDLSEIPDPGAGFDNSTDNTQEDDSATSGSDPEPEIAPTIEYRFNDDVSLLYVQVFKNPNTLASDLAHNHVMRATNWEGYVTYNADDISKCSMAFELPVWDLAVDEDAMRDYVGYGDSINSNDRTTIREHMLASNQLNANTYATIWFESTSCTETAEGLNVAGEMFIAGARRNMIIEMNASHNDAQFYMTGAIYFNHSDFNITPYSAFFGAVQNSQPLEIHFELLGDAN